ncbi:MAG TPA: cytochrome C [Geobacteraceae bacterium]|nr:cytochrome C [Geobacteraceae bacterium]
MLRITARVSIGVLALTMGLNNTCRAVEPFHNGGTGNCDGCHTIPPQLKYSDPSSTCLGCHQAPASSVLPREPYVASNAEGTALCAQLSPGGDFCWLKRSYSWYPDRSATRQKISLGERHGHNIIALDFGYVADVVHGYAPGGNYPAGALSCISCHDPHGSYGRLADGSIRSSGPPIVASGPYNDSPSPGIDSAVGVYGMLAGKGYSPAYLAGSFMFTADPPSAVSPSSYNRAEIVSDTRVAYGIGFSEWCANCHTNIQNNQVHGAGRHPAGNAARFSAEVINNYNSYIASGNLQGYSAISYTSLVPFEMGTNDYTILKAAAGGNGANRNGPQGNANVMCLSCHRAHASGWDNMTRWNMQTEFIVYNGRYPGLDNAAPTDCSQGRTEAETSKTFYDKPAGSFATYQKSLCNKCHSRD